MVWETDEFRLVNRESNKDAGFLCLLIIVIMFVCYTVVLKNSGSIKIAIKLLSNHCHRNELNLMGQNGNQLLSKYFMSEFH